MNRHERYLHELAVLAEDVIPVNGAKLCAAVVINNKVVSYGINSYKTHPMQKRFIHGRYNVEPTKDSKVQKLGFAPPSEPICTHAEIGAIAAALNRVALHDLENATLYVARVKYSDRNKTNYIWGNAKPCKVCSGAINAFKIKNVYFTCEGDDNYGRL